MLKILKIYKMLLFQFFTCEAKIWCRALRSVLQRSPGKKSFAGDSISDHGLLPPLTAEELAAFHRERRELISRFEAKRLELREDRRRRGLPSKRSTTTSSASDPLSTSPCSNDDVFPPPLSLKEQHPVEVYAYIKV